MIGRGAALAFALAGEARAAVIGKDPYFDRLAAEIRGIIVDAEQAITAEHAVRLMAALDGGSASLREAVEAMAGDLRAELGDAVADGVLARIQLAYTRGTVQIMGRERWEFNATDERALAWLGEDVRYWIGEYWSPALATEISDTMAPAFAEGLGARDLAQRLADTMGDRFSRSSSYWRGFATNVTTRSRAFGLTEGAVRAGFRQGVIDAILDDSTSNICRMLDGTTVMVSDMVGLRDALVSAPSPEAIREVAPWQTSDDQVAQVGQQIQALGHAPQGLSLPPYHFHCRTVVRFE
jgi:hypothetical protein